VPAKSHRSEGQRPNEAHALGQPQQTRLPTEVVPHDPALPERAREMWLAADWKALTQIEGENLAHHPERARLAALGAAAALQLGDRQAARAQARRALDWGCSREALGMALLAGTRNTLARASFLARREQKADAHFERSVDVARLSSEVRRHAQGRRDRIAGELRAAIGATAILRKGGGQPAALRAPAWLTGLADRCLAASDVHDAIDQALTGALTLADDRVHLLMLLSDRMLARSDRLTALHFLNAARWFVDEADPELRSELLRKLVALGAADNAVDLAVQAALAPGATVHGTAVSVTGPLQDAYRRMRAEAAARNEHGHELLLAWLDGERPRLQKLADGRMLTLIEIGTTREDVPGQGSTRKLAEYCLRHGLQFITVDMDPHNGRMARELFERLGAKRFEAVTMKGEDYLRQREGPIDLVFLDAYDFDHGKHSELRQSRYEKYLGARIDEQACHRMHLDCAESLVSKLWTHGAVCVDDTWRDNGQWTAKGTLAMPYLLEHQFSLVDARNRAALLVRQPTAEV
jgi:hypothetical protein